MFSISIFDPCFTSHSQFQFPRWSTHLLGVRSLKNKNNKRLRRSVQMEICVSVHLRALMAFPYVDPGFLRCKYFYASWLGNFRFPCLQIILSTSGLLPHSRPLTRR